MIRGLKEPEFRLDTATDYCGGEVKFEMGNQAHGTLGRVADHRATLYPVELQQVSNAVLKRQLEFSTGRYLARESLTRIGQSPVAIGTGKARQPIWPHGVIGSISHSDSLAAAVVAPSGLPYIGLGIDLEIEGRVSDDLQSSILTRGEIRSAQQADHAKPTLTSVFSAKESIFKAIHPLSGSMIDFKEVEVVFNLPNKTFTAEYIGDTLENRLMNYGIGIHRSIFGHNLCLFLITSPHITGK